ncbi:hypothetical protein [Pseudomonas umsongensis]|uniref:hypothetical protein n=1 Tax=Pseudomonas umsongensis TaxID=198618 RepID=UPI0015BBD142|nr:hypothetical protein [Pseudomonas umsongensis]
MPAGGSIGSHVAKHQNEDIRDAFNLTASPGVTPSFEERYWRIFERASAACRRGDHVLFLIFRGALSWSRRSFFMASIAEPLKDVAYPTVNRIATPGQFFSRYF